MDYYKKILEDYKEGVCSILSIDELIEKIRLDEEFENATCTISIIDTYNSRPFKKLEKENEENKELEDIFEAELDQELEVKIAAKMEEIKNNRLSNLKLRDYTFYSSKLFYCTS